VTSEKTIVIDNQPNQRASRIGRRSALLLGVAAASTLVVGAGNSARAAAARKIKITVLYNQPTSPETFEKYYAETHMPLVGKITGISRIELSKVVQAPGGPTPPFYRIAELYFTSKTQMDKVMSTPAAQTAVGDIPKFATGGFTVLVSEIA
jgi:uncharacterized protein (TIGR02118 family)